jgi:hypothetical protein
MRFSVAPAELARGSVCSLLSVAADWAGPQRWR